MTFKFQTFDRSKLIINKLAKRKSNISLSNILSLKSVSGIDQTINIIAQKINNARKCHASVVLMMGAHVIRAGLQRYIIDMMEQGFISCIATNGAGLIHDFELALVGATTESVEHYIKDGQFGLWKETGVINDIVSEAMCSKSGLGESVGRAMEKRKFPHRDISIFAAGYRLKIPVTVHVGIGYDIVYEFPNCNGAAYGATSYKDFLIFTKILESLENGVVMNFGSAVMAPEIYLKALSMVRNVANQKNREIKNFTTLVCDLYKLPNDFRKEATKDNPSYYFRPWKTMLVRTVADGGESYYINDSHTETIPKLWTAITHIND